MRGFAALLAVRHRLRYPVFDLNVPGINQEQQNILNRPSLLEMQLNCFRAFTQSTTRCERISYQCTASGCCHYFAAFGHNRGKKQTNEKTNKNQALPYV